MFDELRATTFILGAGASWHYGYPTGDGLVRMAANKARLLHRYYAHSFKVGNPQLPRFLEPGGDDTDSRWKAALDLCTKMKDGLAAANPLVIDYYLGLNPDLQDIGKLLIAWVILECEEQELRTGKNRNRGTATDADDDWCRFITHHIGLGCTKSEDLLRNKISFVTFNYDLSLETHLRNSLRHYQIFDASTVDSFLGGSRINHVYGKLKPIKHETLKWGIENTDPTKFNEFDWGDYHADFAVFLEAVHAASVDLRVIDPHNKADDAQNITIARSQIATSKRVFILGYGFDENNNMRLDLPETLKQPKKLIFFTNFGNINNVNKRVSRLLTGRDSFFRSESDSHVADLYERSTRNVYDALARDFDL